MIVYHGSTVRVEKPAFSRCRLYTDFGKGFYTTTSWEQAEKWARLKMQREGKGHALVSIFEVPDDLFQNTELMILQFSGPSLAWLDFITANRRGTPVQQYDVVFGPVANDRLYATLTLYEQSILSAEAAIDQLKTHLLFDQISFNSQRVIDFLKFIDAKKID